MITTTKLDPIETASRDELQALQTQRLKWTLNHAYNNVPMYRRKFDAAGVHPDDFRELSDLTKFPCTTKQDLRDNYPFDTFAVPMEQVVRIHASSGTTGKPTVVGYTQNDIDNWANIVARSLRAAGGSAKDKIHVAYGYGLFTGGLGAHYGAERLGATVIPMSGGQTEKQAQLIRGEMRSPYSMIGNIDGSYDAVVFVGYHDAAGQDGNPMAHTISSRRIREVTINGVPAGEVHLFSYAAMGLGVPTAMISGDAAICEKAKAVNSRIETVATKEGVAAAVISRHPKAVERELEEAAKRALSGDLNRYRYALPEHFRVTVAYQKHYDAAYASHYFNTRRLDAHTVEFCSDDYEEVLRFFHFVL